MRDAQILHPSLSRRGEHPAPRPSTDSGPTVVDSRDQPVLNLREQLKAELREEVKEELRAQMKAATQSLTNAPSVTEIHSGPAEHPVSRQPLGLGARLGMIHAGVPLTPLQPTQLVSDEELAQFDDPLPGSVRLAPVFAHGVPAAWTAPSEEAPLQGSPREGTNSTALARGQLDILMQAAGPVLPTLSRPKRPPLPDGAVRDYFQHTVSSITSSYPDATPEEILEWSLDQVAHLWETSRDDVVASLERNSRPWTRDLSPGIQTFNLNTPPSGTSSVPPGWGVSPIAPRQTDPRSARAEKGTKSLSPLSPRAGAPPGPPSLDPEPPLGTSGLTESARGSGFVWETVSPPSLDDVDTSGSTLCTTTSFELVDTDGERGAGPGISGDFDSPPHPLVASRKLHSELFGPQAYSEPTVTVADSRPRERARPDDGTPEFYFAEMVSLQRQKLKQTRQSSVKVGPVPITREDELCVFAARGFGRFVPALGAGRQGVDLGQYLVQMATLK